MISLKPLMLSGREVWPLIEGGKGVAATSGLSSGSWARAGGIGTISGVNNDVIDHNGEFVPLVYKGKTRLERHNELIEYSIKGAISQARIGHDVSGGEGRLHLNVLWEMGGCERVLHGVFEGAKGLIHGITCGAGMPYRLAEIAGRYNVYYYPIVSSARAFSALWKRAYHRVSDWMGGVVYEDPWRAGGHNGLSNSEDPRNPEPPRPRVQALRDTMRKFGLDDTPIVMAGGVWHLDDWADWIDSPELGPIVFQFGTRPLLTRESPIPESWKRRLVELDEGDVLLHRFSPTGFYSSAIYNDFLKELVARSKRQVAFATEADPANDLICELPFGTRGRSVFVKAEDAERIAAWTEAGYTQAMKTPDDRLIYVTPEKAREIKRDQADCMGCLSFCKFSNWSDRDDYTTGKPPDPRSFCIQKTLQGIAHEGDVRNELVFAGHNVFRFKQDPFYSNGFVPTVRELVDRIVTGR
ncbi:MAG: nitronate monooxygenase [Alphaproteobacteria bacterium]|nr:nitronate monooxygenase [Alphaproteobacteria bacterium]